MSVEIAPLLLAITILTVEYWWDVFKSTHFYGHTLVYFLFGVLESGTFYAIAHLLRDFFPLHEVDYAYVIQLKRVLIGFAALIILFIVTDVVKLFEDSGLVKWFWPRQLMRVGGLVAIAYGLCGHKPWIAARILLALVAVYTIGICVADFREKPAPKSSATSQNARASS